ncbi:MAG: serine hydrolase [Cyclobacteriaceae bacterium]|nr:serine hydrolase [Cyclobacteriaceae bacterium]
MWVFYFFQAGSISKPVAALAALKLVEEGKVDLDENINNYLNDWKVPVNAFTANVRSRSGGFLPIQQE